MIVTNFNQILRTPIASSPVSILNVRVSIIIIGVGITGLA